MTRRSLLVLLVVMATAGCTLKDEDGVRPDGTIAPPEDVAAPPADAQRTDSGIAYRVLRVGVGQQPTRTSRVVVHYTGWTTDGEMFDSSVVNGRPLETSITGVIEGWTETLLTMHAGEKRRVWIPGALAYDAMPGAAEQGFPTGTLVFDIDLIAVK
jgi:FKBP-type peptidyl-prolyl cis-trans isomerase